MDSTPKGEALTLPRYRSGMDAAEVAFLSSFGAMTFGDEGEPYQIGQDFFSND